MQSKNCRVCPVCGGGDFAMAQRAVHDFEYASPGEFDYRRCIGCGLYCIDPLPDSQALSLAYPEEYHAYGRQPSRLAAALKARYWKKKARHYASLLRPGARILEVGCASGELLARLHELGFNCMGIDFDAAAVEKARERGLDVHQGELDTFDFSGRTFDMIVMINYIEHVFDPAGILSLCAKLLVPGGLVVGETPNVDAWDRKLFGKYWGGYHTPRHLYLFDTVNLGLLAQRAGLRCDSIRSMLQPAHWALSIQNLCRALPVRPKLRRGRDAFFTSWLLLMAPVNAVQMLCSATSLVEMRFSKPQI
jgi:SAM-dependent methyltransferase